MNGELTGSSFGESASLKLHRFENTLVRMESESGRSIRMVCLKTFMFSPFANHSFLYACFKMRGRQTQFQSEEW